MNESMGVGQKTEKSLGHGVGKMLGGRAKGMGGDSKFRFSRLLFQG